MKFYTTKTKPKCGQWIKVITNDIKIFDLIIAPEGSRYIKSEESYWSEWKQDIMLWQYADKFDTLMRKRLHVGEFRVIKKKEKE